MDINTILEFGASNGFAIVVAIYCLVKLDKQLQIYNETLIKLTTLIEKFIKDEEEESK